MKSLRSVLFAAVVLITVLPVQAAGNLVVDLSKPSIGIATDFIGEDLMIFGSTLGQGEVIIVVRGPERAEVVRRKEKFSGIWINKDSVNFRSVPYFYAVASTLPLETILPEETLIEKKIGAKYLEFGLEWDIRRSADMHEFRNALIRNKWRQGLFSKELANITFLGHQLFRIDIHFPSNVIPGTYKIETYLVRDKKIISQKNKELVIEKVGIESGIYNFAHDKPYYYGIIAVFISAIAGWLVSVFFRKS
ncbi:MAG: TIGR02186 family protein [Rhodospirillales bacterium]